MEVEDVRDLFDEENDDIFGADEAVEDNRYDGVHAGAGAGRICLCAHSL